MKEVECEIKDIFSIDEKDFYLVQEKETGEKHYVPKNQIDILVKVNYSDYYTFIKEYNPNHNKTYLSLILPKYRLGNEIEFDVINKTTINNTLIFELKSEYSPILTVRGYDWQEEQKKIKCKIVGYKRGRPKLRNIDSRNSNWRIDEIKLFKIKGFGNYIDGKGIEQDAIIIETEKGDEIKVKSGKWHTSSFWTFQDIKCKIIGIAKNGLPKLIVYDNRHPIYKKGSSYKFNVVRFETKILNSGNAIEVIKLSDQTQFMYEVLALPNQCNKLNIGQEIECEVTEINTNLHLKQINVEDPFFYYFKDIIDDKTVKNKYFDKYLNDENIKLKSQYIQRSGFWVFTYCNYVLSDIKFNAIQRKDLNELIEIINLHTKFEEWILNKGILQAINEDKDRKQTKTKIQQIISNNQSELKILTYILQFQEEQFFSEQNEKINYKELYYFIKYSNFETINEIQLLNLLKANSNKSNISTESYHYITRLINYITKNISNLKESFQQYYFILSKDLKKKEKQIIKRYINWLILEFELTQIINLTVESNILLAKIYKFYTLLISDFDENKKLLLNAFYVVSNTNEKFKLPIEETDEDLELIIKELPDNPNQGNTIDISKSFYSAHIIEKHYKGYKLFIGDMPGFLPYQNITDPILKGYNENNIDWSINCAITLYCDDFKYFIAKQLETTSENYYSKNNLLDKSIIQDTIVIGTVKSTVNYGIFVSTEYGDGLIHFSKISYDFFNKEDISLLFKKGDKIPVYILNVDDGKLELSLIDLIGTKYEERYYEIIEFFGADRLEKTEDEESNLDFIIELEKGFIFEQYAVIQNVIENKIKYIRFAKAFFSNTKNARSYLLNIYIEYFTSLIKLDNLINEYSFSKYKSFKTDIVKIKEKVQPKTLESFPESKNLLFFIDILNLFNSQSEEDIELLFNLTRKPIEENDILLKAVAKNALANNLIISEISSENDEELNSFTLKNLKRIREYISQGVLSVKERIEDKLAKELNEKRIYWKKKINQDEGEKLEFKATFITPIPNRDQNRIIENLKKQLKKKQSENDIEKIRNKIDELKNTSKKIKGIDKIIMHSALKTICAFANTYGGYLLLGVSDDKKIFGLEQDYNSFKKDKNRDGFGKYFDAMIKNYFGESFSSSLLEKEFLKFPEGDILIIKVNKSPTEIFLLKDKNGNSNESFYVRNLSSTVKLNGIELAKFIKAKLRSQIQEYSEKE